MMPAPSCQLRLVAFAACFVAALAASPRPAGAAPERAEMNGYLIIPTKPRLAATFNAGFSQYTAAWSLLQAYPGHRFQSGLPGTWMFAAKEHAPWPKFYSDVEGGLGWWTDTQFPSEAPKFIMGGVGIGFSEIANGPSHGAGDWRKPRGVYGVAQLSSRLVFPIDGLNIKQGAAGGLVGYGYLPLPLAKAKPTTEGKDIPTGPNCWTLFLNTGNFKGPLAFFTPYFWSHVAAMRPELVGCTLDCCGTDPNRAVQMETQWLPAYQATDSKGETWARIGPVQFPCDAEGRGICIHRITSYSKAALWDAVKAWFDGGPAPSGAVNPAGEVVQDFSGGGYSTWRIGGQKVKNNDERPPVHWPQFAKPLAVDPHTYGFKWDLTQVDKIDTPAGSLAVLPQYYHLNNAGTKKAEWLPVKAADVPAETGLADLKFERPKEGRPKPYTTPEDPASSWKTPGPKAGPFQIKLGDGSTVTYYWYRFCDQPALLNADLTDAEREAMQKKVELLHRAWSIDRDYLAPPSNGTLADLDPAQLVTPPPGLEVGYVPIATRQAAGE
jgi:hypothetical protein